MGALQGEHALGLHSNSPCPHPPLWSWPPPAPLIGFRWCFSPNRPALGKGFNAWESSDQRPTYPVCLGKGKEPGSHISVPAHRGLSTQGSDRPRLCSGRSSLSVNKPSPTTLPGGSGSHSLRAPPAPDPILGNFTQARDQAWGLRRGGSQLHCDPGELGCPPPRRALDSA